MFLLSSNRGASPKTFKFDAQPGVETRVTAEFYGDPGGREAVLIAPGIGANGEYYKEMRGYLARELGHVAITVDPARLNWLQAAKDVGELREKSIDGAMKKISRELGVTAFHLLGHSYGGPNSIRAVRRTDQPVKSVTLAASAGLKRGDTPLNALWRGASDFGEIVKCSPATLLRATGNTFHNPWQLGLEALDASTVDIHDDVIEIAGSNVPVHNFQFGKDKMFPTEDVDRDTASLPFQESVIVTEGDACHLGPNHIAVPTAIAYHRDILGYEMLDEAA